jgi:hypothetical protein
MQFFICANEAYFSGKEYSNRCAKREGKMLALTIACPNASKWGSLFLCLLGQPIRMHSIIFVPFQGRRIGDLYGF